MTDVTVAELIYCLVIAQGLEGATSFGGKVVDQKGKPVAKAE
jgi:hypothetical protein